MTITGERGLWRWAGAVTAASAVVLFSMSYYVYWDTGEMRRWPLRLGITGSFALLSAISFLVISRVLGALQGQSEGPRGSLWRMSSYGGIPLGILVMAVESIRVWMETRRVLTSANKAVFAAGAFSIMAGVVSLIGERCVAHLAGSGDHETAKKAGA